MTKAVIMKSVMEESPIPGEVALDTLTLLLEDRTINILSVVIFYAKIFYVDYY